MAAAKRKKSPKKSRAKSTVNKRRKGFLSVALPWMRRFGVIAAALVLALWLGAWFYLSGAAGQTGAWTQQRLVALSAQGGFTVENILVEGRVHTQSEIIMALINMRKGDPVFAFSPHEAQQQLERISWVEHAHVERRLPGTIYIRLRERTPLARLADGDQLTLLDDKGEAITGADAKDFPNLMLVAGQGAPENLGALARALGAQPDLKDSIRLARYVGTRRWDLALKSGVKIKLPEDGVEAALERLARAHEQSGLLDKDVTDIDLREPDRLAVRVKSGQVQNYQVSAPPGNDI